MLIQAQNCNIYRNKELVIKDLNWTLPQSTFVEIIGHNRSGKSTLLETIYGLHASLTGHFEVLNCDLVNGKPESKATLRRRLGMCFQYPLLLQDKTIRANIALAAKAAEIMPKEEFDEEIQKLASLFNLEPKLKEETRFLSYSEKQLTCLAQALINRPAILLLDQFFDSFDESNALRIVEALSNWKEKYSTSIVLTSNEINTFLPSDRVIMQCRNQWFGRFGHQ